MKNADVSQREDSSLSEKKLQSCHRGSSLRYKSEKVDNFTLFIYP